jgi:hypothetical protein
MTNTRAKPSNRRGGSSSALQKRPHLQVPGDELWPIVDIAADFYVCERSAKRRLGYVAGVASYANIGIARKMLANRFLAANRWGRR